MYYGNQPWPAIRAMSDWEIDYAFTAVSAVIRAETRAQEDAHRKAKAESD